MNLPLFQQVAGVFLPTVTGQNSIELVVIGIVLIAVILAGTFLDITALIFACMNPDRWTRGKSLLLAGPWSWRDGAVVALFVIAAFSMGQAFVRLILLMFPEAPKIPLVHLTVIWAAAFQFLSLALVAHLVARSASTFGTVFFRRRYPAWRTVATAVLSYLGVLPPVMAAAIISFVMLTAVGFDVMKNQQDAIKLFADPSVPVYLKCVLAFLAVVVAPVSEELMFRGIMLPAISQRTGVVVGIIATSFLFSAVHVNIPSFLPLTVLGAALSLSYIFSGNIGVPITLHVVFNCASIGFVFLRLHLKSQGVPI